MNTADILFSLSKSAESKKKVGCTQGGHRSGSEYNMYSGHLRELKCCDEDRHAVLGSSESGGWRSARGVTISANLHVGWRSAQDDTRSYLDDSSLHSRYEGARRLGFQSGCFITACHKNSTHCEKKSVIYDDIDVRRSVKSNDTGPGLRANALVTPW